MVRGMEIDPATLFGAMGALASAIVYLFRRLHTVATSVHNDVSEKLNKCEEKHEESNIRMIEMSEKLGRLEGRMEGYGQARADMHKLSNKVLEIIEGREKGKNDTSGG